MNLQHCSRHSGYQAVGLRTGITRLIIVASSVRQLLWLSSKAGRLYRRCLQATRDPIETHGKQIRNLHSVSGFDTLNIFCFISDSCTVLYFLYIPISFPFLSMTQCLICQQISRCNVLRLEIFHEEAKASDSRTSLFKFQVRKFHVQADVPKRLP